jgi:hypothetical protein
MKRTALALGLAAAALTSSVSAAEGPVPRGVQHLDHVFVIMMENHGFSQIANNPNAPFLNQYAQAANLATNYFAVAHPSLTNYLEVVGGSNFGVLSDNNPDWHNASCSTNLATGVAATDNPPTGPICPIAGTGTDAETPAVDYTNETQGPPGENNLDGVASVPAENKVVGKTIADQLVARRGSWKSYEESLPPEGADRINYADGFYSNLTDFSTILPVLNPPLTQADVVALYAAKHAPFVYFKNVQRGNDRDNSLGNIVDFDSAEGLFADLRSGRVPTFSFIAPNQCNDQHGRGNAGAFCNFDPEDNGSQDGLNPALIYRGDVTAKRIVDAIHDSPAWHQGRNAIVLLWDENDYSLAPNTNQVMTIVETNYARHRVESSQFYTHYSLLKTLEGAFNLPCLNHACDSNVAAMTDLFSDNHH